MKICTECRKRNGNPMHAGICNVCHSNAIFGDPNMVEKEQQKAEKFLGHSKDIVSIIFGVIALVWFIIMLPAQADFQGIVVGWVIIGAIYLIFKIFYKW